MIEPMIHDKNALWDARCAYRTAALEFEAADERSKTALATAQAAVTERESALRKRQAAESAVFELLNSGLKPLPY